MEKGYASLANGRIMEISNQMEPVVLPAPAYAPVKENEQVLLALGITVNHIAALPIIVRTGVCFLLLEVRNYEVLQSLHPAPENMRLLSDEYELAGFCIFAVMRPSWPLLPRAFLPAWLVQVYRVFLLQGLLPAICMI
ncbi:hypothetical protein [Paraflavitalea speifideaquila]|uniref:hypothetical protein n=1 Tax=Paraflavitalea speifideaquila TaxID=3076558 RepID=UPI0028E3148F|nr:hypothetical protein [Paraflavitalea speifideiaquila]